VLRNRCHALESEALALGASGVKAAALRPPLPSSERADDSQGERDAAARVFGSVHEEALAAVRAQKQQLEAQVDSLQRELNEARGALELVGQPHSFLLEQLAAAKAKAREAGELAEALRGRLAQRDGQVAELSLEREGLQRDLDALRAQRSSLDQMKQLVMKAVGASGAGFTDGLGGHSGATRGGSMLLQGVGTSATSIVE
jgi:hypothetical protein